MATYKPIQSVTLAAATSSVTFSGIDQSYTDLVIVGNAATSVAGAQNVMRFNGSTGNYGTTELYATGSSIYGYRFSGQTYMWFSSGVGIGSTLGQSSFTININNYSNSTTYKTALMRLSSNSGTYPGVVLSSGLWVNTSPITSVTLYADTGSTTWSAGSTLSLYGIKSGAPQALGGDVVTTDGTYWYHAFKTTGAFTPLKTLSADYLVVAGGGAGGAWGAGGGGGGAGGYRYLNSQSFSTVQTVTIGAGGAGYTASTYNNNTNDGTSSSIGSISASGGGAGSAGNFTGRNGGSGGGGNGGYVTSGGSGNAGSYSPVEGYAGSSGATISSSAYLGGGGGGAGSAGTAANTGTAVAGGGGAGLNTLSSWFSITGTGVSGYIAGGGGGGGFYNTSPATTGGSGGSGGGGAGGVTRYATGTSGTANTGGGGGGAGGSDPGSSNPTTSGSGGSGIVIVRYPV